MNENFAFDVFLSHNSKDKARVRELAGRLRAAGLKVWLDEDQIKPGDIIALKVDAGLEQARTLVLCLSAAALLSDWVALERSTAVHRDPANTGRRFIPLLLTDCDLPDSLRRYKYVDYRESNQSALDEVLSACRVQRDSQTPASEPKSKKKPPKRKAKPVKPTKEAQGLAVLERTLKGTQG